MALKKDNLPVNVDVDTEQGSSITYANEVVAIIAGVAASEVEKKRSKKKKRVRVSSVL